MNILSLIFDWILSHPSIDVTIVVALYEVVVRKLNTTVSLSILDFIKTLVDKRCPNKIIKSVVDDSIIEIEENQKTTVKTETITKDDKPA